MPVAPIRRRCLSLALLAASRLPAPSCASCSDMAQSEQARIALALLEAMDK